jgi:hypothetical protein
MKKGNVHLEMVISFSLFVLFVLFILLYVKPFKQGTLSESAVSGLKEAFDERVNIPIVSGFLKTDTDKPCFSVSVPGEGGSIVRKEGLLVESGLSLGSLTIRSSAGNYRIIISPEIARNEFSCEALEEGEYTLGIFNNESIVYSGKLDFIKEQYENNYPDLKTQLRIPENFDFAVTSNMGFNLERPIPEQIEVFARSYGYTILESNGEIKNAQLTFKIW